MPPKKNPQDLGRRERQILDVIFRLGEAPVADVLALLPDEFARVRVTRITVGRRQV